MNGFVGRRSNYYFTKVKDTLQDSQTLLLQLSSGTESVVASKTNAPLPYTDGVSVEDDTYEYINSRVRAVDEEMANKLQYVMEKLETLCKEQFVIPSVTPQVEMIIEKIKVTLPDFIELGWETTNTAMQFAGQIDTIDY